MTRPSSQHYKLITNVVTHTRPVERELQKSHGFPSMSTGTYPVRDLVSHFRALRKQHMRMARLCVTDEVRREYVDYAFAASWQVRAQKAKARGEQMRFGAYMQRELAQGVWKLEMAEA